MPNAHAACLLNSHSNELLVKHLPHYGKMSFSKLATLIANGYGRGHFENYRSFLPILRSVTGKRKSVQGHSYAFDWNRLLNYWSDDENNTFQLLKYLGAQDIRDHLPCWPWADDHPINGLPGAAFRPNPPGITSIAAQAGIQLWNWPGAVEAGVPYIPTLDIMTTWEVRGEWVLAAYECKPMKIILAPDVLNREKARLELGRRYCGAANIKRFATSTWGMPKALIRNLHELDPRLAREDKSKALSEGAYELVIETINRDRFRTSPAKLLQKAAAKYSLNVASLHKALRLGIWSGDIDHDIRQPLEFAVPLKEGGVDFKNALFQKWVGL